MDRTRETLPPQQQQHSDTQTGVILPALKVGVLAGPLPHHSGRCDIQITYGAAGTTGFITGGLIATLKSSPTPGLFALGTGANCFFLASTYCGQLPTPGDYGVLIRR